MTLFIYHLLVNSQLHVKSCDVSYDYLETG